MINDLPPWKEDPHNPTRKSGEKRKDKYGNEIKNVAKYLARKAMNTVKETVFVSSRKKDLTAVKSEDTIVFDDHNNCGTPDCCQTCDTADTTEIDEASAFGDARRDLRRDSKGLAPTKRDEDDSESNEDPDEDKTPHLVSQLYKAVSINKPVKFKDGKSHTIAPHHAKKFINQYRSLKPADKEELQSKAHASHAEFKRAISEDIVRTGTLAQRTQAYRADKAKKAGAKLKMDPDTGTPDHFTAAMRRKKGLPEAVENIDELSKNTMGSYVKKASGAERPKNVMDPKNVPLTKIAAYQGDSETGHFGKRFNQATYDKAERLRKNRETGIKTAVNKLTKEELDKSNEWGTDALRRKYAAATPGQEGLAAKKIPTFDARYDDVPTRYIGGVQKEETLLEISARGAIARQDFKTKMQKVLSDPKAIARAKKTIAKKKAAEADAPKNLVHQLHKSQSINAKVTFYDGKEHEIASNHHDKFMNKYHGLKSSIEKESLVKRAHKSHEEFLKAIHEEFADFSQEKPNTDSITPANYPTPPMHNDMMDYNSDDRHDEYDLVAIENDVTAEIENAEWEDLVDYYDYEDLNYEDSDEDIAEGITPQGRLKKRFNMMRTKGRRNLARNMALKRVATPDRIKSRSVRAARNMVYSRVLRGRDRSSLSASEKTRLEGMVKRMAPMVGRLSIRLQQKERMIDRKRINNRNKRKKK